MRILYIGIGLLSLALGTVGIFFPILPTTPFYLLAAFCFGKSSKKLHDWFLSTSLYKKHMKGLIKGRGLTVKSKCSLIGSVTLIMAIGFLAMAKVPVGRLVLCGIWAAHLVYFGFVVKTIPADPKEMEREQSEYGQKESTLENHSGNEME